MPQITQNDLQTLMDKLARYACIAAGDLTFDDSFNAGLEIAGTTLLEGGSGIPDFLLGLNDIDVEADLLPAARDVFHTHPTLPASALSGIPSIRAMINAINAHFVRYGFSSLDAYLTSINNPTATLRMHGLLRQHLQMLSPSNVFIPNDLQLAHFAITGAATGTYTHVAAINTLQYAPAKLVVKNDGALNSAAHVNVTGKKPDGTTQVLTATLSTGDGDETDLSSTAKAFVDVTTITLSSGGTNGDAFKVMAKTDRDISGA